MRRKAAAIVATLAPTLMMRPDVIAVIRIAVKVFHDFAAALPSAGCVKAASKRGNGA